MTQSPNTPVRSLISRIFISPDEARLRAGWRLLVQTILMIGFTVLAGLIFLVVYVLTSGKTSIGDTPYLAVSEVIEFVVIAGSVFLVRRFVDKRSFVSLGFRMDGRTVFDILTGFGITFIMMGLILLVEMGLGWVTITTFAWNVEPYQNVIVQALVFLLIFIVGAINEELLSRGYHLQTITSGLNLFWGLVISSAVFGALHLANPNATWVSALGIFFAGLFLAYAYICSGQLWLSIGLHLGWNFFEGVVFGFPVSGLNIYSLTRLQVSGPELWTGGNFGPEAGLIILPALVLGSGLVYLYTRSHKNP